MAGGASGVVCPAAGASARSAEAVAAPRGSRAPARHCARRRVIAGRRVIREREGRAMVRAILGARGLIAMVIAAGDRHWGLHAYPVQTDNLFLALIALKKPFVFSVLTYGYATLWFTTPFFAASLVMSVLAIVAYRYPHGAAARAAAVSRTGVRPTPSLVLGEAHFARTPGPAPDPDVAHDSTTRPLHRRDDSRRRRHRQDVGLHVSVRRSAAALARRMIRSAKSAGWCWK